MYVIIINKMPKNVRAKPIRPQHLPNELQFNVIHDQHKKAMLKRHEIFEVSKNRNQNEVDDEVNEGRKKNTKFPKGHKNHNKNNKHHKDYKR